MSGSGSVTAIIPARMGSVRFPGKALRSETGLPLVVHVAIAAGRASALSRVVVATEDREIVDACVVHGVEAVLTGEHPNGTSRLHEAAGLLGLSPEDLVVNVQGDEPEIAPEAIDLAVQRHRASDTPDVSTLAAPIRDRADFTDPNVVKVVLDRLERALYFSRAAIPHDRDGDGHAGALRHIGLYVYSVRFLGVYASLGETCLERTESLEQLRVLEHGHRIGVALVDEAHSGIDTPEQYAAFVARFGA